MSVLFTRVATRFVLAAVVLLSTLVGTVSGASAQNTISAGAPSGTITLANPNVSVPVVISRSSGSPAVFAFSVVFRANAPLALTGSAASSITLPPGGGYLNADGGRNVVLQNLDQGGGVYKADGVTLGSPCGSSALAGTLFNVALTSAALGGSPTVEILSVTLRDCGNAPIAATVGAASTVVINRSTPTVTVVSPNGGETFDIGSTHNVTWTATDPEGVTSVDLAYSVDGGATYPFPIATGIANSGSHSWLVPNAPSSTVRVRVTARDGDANSAADASDASFSIACPTITVTPVTTHVACFGASTGAIDISVSGGTAPYSYLWSNGATTEDVSGLVAGNYSVTVTDANGCTGNTNATITQPAAALALNESHINVACFGASTGSIDLSVSGGTSPYTYLWSNGATTQDVSGLAAGSYSVTVTDANGCIASLPPVAITQPAQLLAGETHTDACLTAADGTIDLSVSGGTSPYTYLWSNGATTQDLSALAAGGYSVTVTDANGCTAGLNVTIGVRSYTIAASAGPNGTIVPNGSVPVSCGADQSFTITANPGYHVLDVVVDAVAQGPQSGWTFTNVMANHTIAVTFAINPAVAAVANLAATQVLTGNPAGSVTRIALTWNAVPLGQTVEVWRAPYGHYPRYDEDGGSEPAVVPAYPPGGPWALTAVTSSGGLDLPATRDFYYYVAYTQDVYGTWSPASNRTAGTLNYHLGDVSNGFTAGVGDNEVTGLDISLLGANYGLSGGALASVRYLDVGPTSTSYLDGRPLTDQATDFEDLVMFALNYNAVSAPAPITERGGGSPATADELRLEAPSAVVAGTTATARLTLAGTGTLRAVSTRLSWDPAVVEPAELAAGAWLSGQDGVAFAPAPGTIDAAVLAGAGMSGEGELATLTFRVVAAGDPRIRIASIVGRDDRNRSITVLGSQPTAVPAAAPRITQLAPSRPNPFTQTATIAFSLAAAGPVELSVYSVDGRMVRALARDVREPGDYSVVWDGRDDQGTVASTGVYYVRLVTGQGRFVRTATYLR